MFAFDAMINLKGSPIYVSRFARELFIPLFSFYSKVAYYDPDRVKAHKIHCKKITRLREQKGWSLDRAHTWHQMRCETNDLDQEFDVSDDEGVHDQRFVRVWKDFQQEELDSSEDEYDEDQPLVKDKYDVFINHRGKDVKNTLASLVYHNLLIRNLKVFLDNKTIEHGHSITLEIERAIRTASVHIAIFSPNYAESASCLKELCLMKESGAPIIPIFFGVRPCELRVQHENGFYAQAFQKHLLAEKVNTETVDKWKASLTNEA